MAVAGIVPRTCLARQVASTADANPALSLSYRIQIEVRTISTKNILGLLGKNAGQGDQSAGFDQPAELGSQAD